MEHVASIDNGRGIDRHASLVDVLNDPFFIDHEGRTISKALLLVKDAVISHDSAFEIAE